jgi:hypothetical protein
VSKNIATARPFIRLGKQSQRRDAPAASLNHGLILPCTRIIKFSVEQSRDIPKDGNRSGTRLWPRWASQYDPGVSQNENQVSVFLISGY